MLVIGILTIFFILNAAVVILSHKKQDSFEEYSVGSRSFGWILVSFALMGGFYEGSLYTNLFTESNSEGILAQSTLIYYVGAPLVLFLMIEPVWIWGKVYGLQTQSDLIELRYNSKLFKILFSSVVFILWMPLLIVEMKLTGFIISIITDGYINNNIGMILICMLVIIYVFYGGLRASANSSVLQVLTFIILGTIVFSFLIYKTYGGILPLFKDLESANPSLLILQKDSGGNFWTSYIMIRILSLFCWPSMFSVLYMAESPRALKKIILISPIFGVFITLSTLLLGLGGSMLREFPFSGPYGIFFIAEKFGGTLMLALTGIVALSACMATLSGVIGTAAVIVAKDFLGLIKGRSNTLVDARICTIIIGLIFLWISTVDIPNIFIIGVVIYNCVAQAIVPLLLGQYWKKSNLYGAAIGMLIGMGFTIYASFFPNVIEWANGFSAGIIGLGINLLIHIILGYAFGKQDHVDEIFDVVRNYKEDKIKHDKLI